MWESLEKAFEKTRISVSTSVRFVHAKTDTTRPVAAALLRRPDELL